MSRLERAGRESERVSKERREQKTEEDEAREQSVVGGVLLMTRRARASAKPIPKRAKKDVNSGDGGDEREQSRQTVDTASGDLWTMKKRGSSLSREQARRARECPKKKKENNGKG